MWTSLSQDDLLAARDSLKQREVEMATRHLEELEALEAKHAEERNALEARFRQINELEHVIGGFVEEYLETSSADVPPEPTAEPPEVQAAPAEPLPKPVEVDATKRWRQRFGLA